MRQPPPPKKNGRGHYWAHSRKTTLTPKLSLYLHPGLGGKRKREREESNREKEIPHTHTHSRTRACRSNRSGGTKKKPAGRDRARGVRIKRKLTDSIGSHFRSNKGPRHFNTPSLRPWISSRSLAGSHGVSGINKSNNTSQPGC